MDVHFQVMLFTPLHPATSLAIRDGKSVGLAVGKPGSNPSQLCNSGSLLSVSLSLSPFFQVPDCPKFTVK